MIFITIMYPMSNSGVVEETQSIYRDGWLPLIGTPGKHTWRFQPVADGTVTLTFVYAQQWEGGGLDEATRFELQVVSGRIKLIKQEKVQ